MNNIQLRFVFDRKKQATENTTGLLQIEARLKGTNKSVYISTGIKLYKSQFSDKNGFTCIKHDKSGKINYQARTIYNKIEAFALSEKCHSLEDVKNFDTVESYTYSVAEFIRERMVNQSGPTEEHHKLLLKRLEEFGSFKTFDDLTYINLLDFDNFLRKTISSQPTLYKRHSVFKHYIVMAIKSGLAKHNPYDDFKIDRGKSKEPTFLTEDEMKLIENWKSVSDKLSKVRDIFVFQAYTGLAYVDVLNFDKSKIEVQNGKEIIRSSRTKTNEAFISLLLPKAKAILEKYDYKLPVITNQKYNDYLKLVGAGAEISKVLTSHVARHTYATYLINNGISILTVSKALGHSNTKMSEHYAKILANTVINEMSKLM